MFKSACGLAGLLSVAGVLVVAGAVAPVGGVSRAVSAQFPRVPLGTVPVIVKVATPPLARLIVVAMSPLPLAAPQALPVPLVVHVQVKPAPLSAPGSGSETGAPVTSLGPWFVAVTVYVSVWPGTYG